MSKSARSRKTRTCVLRSSSKRTCTGSSTVAKCKFAPSKHSTHKMHAARALKATGSCADCYFPFRCYPRCSEKKTQANSGVEETKDDMDIVTREIEM